MKQISTTILWAWETFAGCENQVLASEERAELSYKE